MPAQHFTLIVDGADLQDEAVLDRLFEAGCDDALVGSTGGVQFVDFDRDAAGFATVLSAVADVEQAAGVRVIRLAGAGLFPSPPHGAHTRERAAPRAGPRERDFLAQALDRPFTSG